jgi:hypothetical protein
MDSYVTALTIFLTILMLVYGSCSVSLGMPDPDDGHDHFEVSDSEEADDWFKLINDKYNRSLIVYIRNTMAGSSGTSTIISDCYAYSDNGQLLSPLGAGPIIPKQATLYWMNLIFFTPSVETVDCNVTAPAGKSRTSTMYDASNMELSSRTIQWSIDERGFSLYNSESDSFNLYELW